MTHMLKKQSNSMASPGIPSGALGMHRNSHMISKVQPKIRIIHIFAPEIIKTDVANFRELVQRLTGKPSPENNVSGKGKGKSKGKMVKGQHHQHQQQQLVQAGGGMIGCDKPTVNTKLEVMMGPTGSSSSPSSSSDHHHQRHHHHHQDVWRSSSSSSGDHNNNHNHNNNNNTTSGGYLSGFQDLEDNFDFSTVFHMGAADGSSHLNAFGETTQLSFRG